MSNYLGVDVSKERLDAVFYRAGETVDLGSFGNDAGGHQQLARQLPKTEERIHLVVEPTGGYELPLVIFGFEQGWAVSLPNPKRVRDWAHAMGNRAKNDRIDSRVLAAYGAATEPEPQNELPAEIAALDSLLRRREDLEKMVREERNRRQALAYKPRASDATRKSVERVIEVLEEELAQVEEDIQELLDEHPHLKTEVRRLLTVNGIGSKTVLPILVFLYRWQARTAGKGTAKGATAFAGLDPQEHRSGSSVYKRSTISKMGCRFTRCQLYLAAKGGVRARSSPLRHFYDRLRGRGKPHDLALIAGARKILVWAFVVFTRQVPFDPALAAPNPA